uniref:beta-galactosidase n=1 Tax=Salix viminalis TaxID=40686 RepID=A0A6N2LI85_SALVM
MSQQLWMERQKAFTGPPQLTETTTTANSRKTMARRSRTKTKLIFLLISLIAFLAFVPVFAPLPSFSSHYSLSHRHRHRHQHRKVVTSTVAVKPGSFEIDDDKFWKDGEHFRIIGGDLHYFRVLPQYWEDRLVRAKALGLNTIQTYVPWNLHEPQPEWDFGGFPAWLLAIEPPLKLRSSDSAYLRLVRQHGLQFCRLITGGESYFQGPIIMVQIENEFGSYGDDKAYLHHLVELARGHLGDEIILYTTDGGDRENLEKGTIRGDAVFSSWLTHWGEKNAKTDADFTASALEQILSRNGSAVLYMVHGGTNFGFYNGANTGVDDAPISESGDVENAKFNALRRVIGLHTAASLPSVPSNNGKMGYGPIQLQKTAFLFDLLDNINPADVVESENPLSMESVGQVHDRAQVFTLCHSKENSRRPTHVGSIDRLSSKTLGLPNAKCASNISLFVLVPDYPASHEKKLLVVLCKLHVEVKVENQGRVNYGSYIFDKKLYKMLPALSISRAGGNLCLLHEILHGWKMIPIPFHNLNEVPKINAIIQVALSRSITVSTQTGLKDKSGKSQIRNVSEVPAFFTGHFFIENADQIQDTFISFSGWGKGIAVVNDFYTCVNALSLLLFHDIYFPTFVYNFPPRLQSFGPQCNLYVPAPILRHGENVLETIQPELVIHSVDHPDFTCGSRMAAVVAAAAAAPSFTPPAAFIAPATLANIATPPPSIARRATAGFTAISYGNCK